MTTMNVHVKSMNLLWILTREPELVSTLSEMFLPIEKLLRNINNAEILSNNKAKKRILMPVSHIYNQASLHMCMDWLASHILELDDCYWILTWWLKMYGILSKSNHYSKSKETKFFHLQNKYNKCSSLVELGGLKRKCLYSV